MAETSQSKATFRVEGMTCQNCARHVREAAEGVPGVLGAAVDLSAGRLQLRWASDAAGDAGAVVAAVGGAGFRASPLAAGELGEKHIHGGHGWRFNVVFGGGVTLFLALGEWGLGWGHASWFRWLAMGLGLVVQVICGARFYRGAWAQLKRGSSNMDTLVALGSTAAFAFSAWTVWAGAGHHVYFLEASAIITLISLGHWLEALASERTAGAIRALMNLSPPTARRLDADATEREVPAGDLLPGDRVVMRPGDRVPTDAEVLEGMSAVDESMLTGESKPVEKAKGASVFAGTVNLDGRLVGRVSAAGEATALAHIIAAVERAQNSRAGIQRLADQVSSVFVPVVIALAIVTALAWGLAPEWAREVHAWFGRFLWSMHLPETPLAAAVIHATAVLIIACPCAMGLATPAAIMAGTNLAALRGILVRDGVALEKAGHIDTVVFDKTGTLTLGRLTVTEVRDLRPEAGRGEPLRSIAAGVAGGSAHPVARALAALANEQVAGAVANLPPVSVGAALPTTSGTPSNSPGLLLRTDLKFAPRPARSGLWIDWREHRGRGVEARRSGEESVVYRLGSLAWLHECGVGNAAGERGGELVRGALVTVVGLAADDQLLGEFELRDVLRPEAREVVAGLHHDGFDVFLLSGDGWLAAEAVGREAGIPSAQVLAEVKPEQKAEAVARLQAEGRRVAFVGDGINDGPALARADLGIAVSRAADVARESADIVLIRPELGHLREALGLAQATLRTIRQNLFWAFFYNAAAVPLAMLGFFSPVVCAAAMGLSDLMLVGNSFRLRYWTLARRPPRPAPVDPSRAGKH